jgi:putative transcriptional regulator
MISSVIKIQLKKILEEKKKSLYWLAKSTDISYNALAKIQKNDVTRLELDTIEKICISLECEPGMLLQIVPTQNSREN